MNSLFCDEHVALICLSVGLCVKLQCSFQHCIHNSFVTLNRQLNFFFCVCLFLSPSVSSENDLDLNFCGIWRHGKGSLSLAVNLSTGCKGISISANTSSLSIDGQITAQCRRSDVIPLKQFGFDSAGDSNFCLYWEPLLDQLKLQVNQKKGRNRQDDDLLRCMFPCTGSSSLTSKSY